MKNIWELAMRPHTSCINNTNDTLTFSNDFEQIILSKYTYILVHFDEDTFGVVSHLKENWTH